MRFSFCVNWYSWKIGVVKLSYDSVLNFQLGPLFLIIEWFAEWVKDEEEEDETQD